ncbi:hypothetical protein GOBAR_DD12425 [Gossypium barbadense]|nr:hypothetical protein GOBAR_DD12425 [Gossypium barbadense]
MGVVKFDDSSSVENPLPDHDDNGVDVRAGRFKKLVEKLINMGVVKFDDSSSVENPLPDHDDNGVDVRAGRGLVIFYSGGNHGKTRNHCKFHHEKGYET